MKQTILKPTALKFAFFLILSSAPFFTSCKNDEEEQIVITEEDAYDVIEGTLQSDTYGLTETVAKASETAEDLEVYTETPEISCGTTYTNSYTASDSGINYSYSYSAEGNYLLNCTNLGLPSSFEFNNTISGNYDASRMSSNDQSESELTVTGLAPTSANAVFNGNYERKGTQQSKVRNQRTFESVVSYNLTNLEVSKSLHKINGGVANLTVSLSTSGVTKSYNANLTFNGDYTATLVMNGHTYTINF